MGSGNRFRFTRHMGFGIGVYLSRFPFNPTIIVSLGLWDIQVGLGKAYDER
jgi:hypothetical protein